ncbi:MAG: DNA primase catalytic subunit PriS [Candidatus Odinarchaeota archaeon]
MTASTVIPDKELFKKALKKYYEEEFKPDRLLQVISRENFHNREFGYQDIDKHFNRNISFESVEELVSFLIEKTPTAFYAGAVYSDRPSKDMPIHKLTWQKREFVFDIDLDMYDTARTCGCKGADQLCEICWEHVKTASYFIDDTLRRDFGIKNQDIQWVFSGRRGVHAWVKDPKFSYFNQDVRSAIIEYMSLIKGDKIILPPRKDEMPLFKKRVDELVIKRFFKIVTREDLVSIGLSENKARRIYADREATGVTDFIIKNHVFTSRNTIAENERIMENILKLHYPRIDHKVSIDLRRLLRAPSSVHGETGNIVTFLTLQELASFNPLKDATNIMNL